MAHTLKECTIFFLGGGGKSLKMTIHDLHFCLDPCYSSSGFCYAGFLAGFPNNQPVLLGFGPTSRNFSFRCHPRAVRNNPCPWSPNRVPKKNCRNDDDQIIQIFIGLPRSVRIFSAENSDCCFLDLLNGLTLWNHPTPPSPKREFHALHTKQVDPGHWWPWLPRLTAQKRRVLGGPTFFWTPNAYVFR